MDSITHVALGAIIGEAVAGKKLGKKAMVIGALAQSFPDIDFLMSVWLRPVDNLLIHRGLTHSIFIGVIVSVLAGLLGAHWSKSDLSRTKWMVFIGLEIAIHLLLDSLNNYGTGWFEPFSHYRVSFNVIYVADPFYSIWLAIGMVALLFIKTDSSTRVHWARLTLIVSSFYLAYALMNKIAIEHSVKKALEARGIISTNVLTTPTPLNNWLWFVAAETEDGFFVAHRSVFDKGDSIRFAYFPQQLGLLKELKDKEDYNKLVVFSQGYYTLDLRKDALEFNDLRFGQIAGWTDPRAMFAFHYDLYHPDANLFVVQQGRFSNWNGETVSALLKRISGDQSVGGK